jgi:hypothetical protein
MASELLAGLSIFKSMFDIAKGLKDVSDAVARNAVAIELQEKIVAAQLHQSALIQQLDELEKEVADLKTWKAEKQRYALTDFGGGTYALLLRPEMSNGEPPHRLCATCYQKEQKFILHFQGKDAFSRDLFVCHGCKTTYHFGVMAPYQPRRTYKVGGGRTWMAG